MTDCYLVFLIDHFEVEIFEVFKGFKKLASLSIVLDLEQQFISFLIKDVFSECLGGVSLDVGLKLYQLVVVMCDPLPLILLRLGDFSFFLVLGDALEISEKELIRGEPRLGCSSQLLHALSEGRPLLSVFCHEVINDNLCLFGSMIMNTLCTHTIDAAIFFEIGTLILQTEVDSRCLVCACCAFRE